MTVLDDAGPVVEVSTDRCDARDCDAQAYVYAKLPTGSLSYCGHHGTEYWERLQLQSIVVIDLRHQIPR